MDHIPAHKATQFDHNRIEHKAQSAAVEVVIASENVAKLRDVHIIF